MRSKITVLLLLVFAAFCGQPLHAKKKAKPQHEIFRWYADSMDNHVEACEYRSELLFGTLSSDTVNLFFDQFIEKRSAMRKKILADCPYPRHDLTEIQQCIRNIQAKSTRPDVTRKFVEQLQIAVDSLLPKTAHLPMDSIRTEYNSWFKVHRVYPTEWHSETQHVDTPICMQKNDTLFILTNDQRYFNDTTIWSYSHSGRETLQHVFNMMQPRETPLGRTDLSIQYDLSLPPALILSTGKDAVWFATNDYPFALCTDIDAVVLQQENAVLGEIDFLNLNAFVLTDTVLTFADLRIGQTPQEVCQLMGLNCPQGIRHIVLLTTDDLMLSWETEKAFAQRRTERINELEGVFLSFYNERLYRIESCFYVFNTEKKSTTFVERITHSGQQQEQWCKPVK